MSTSKKGTDGSKSRIVKNSHTKKAIIAALLTSLGIVVYMLLQQYTYQAKIEAELNSKKTQVQSQLQELNKKNDLTTEQQKQIEQLNKEKEELNKQLQAKRNTARVLAEAAPVRAKVSNPQCLVWMEQAGIPITAASTRLILNESGCRYNAKNPTSGACGIPQALPCSKLPCTLDEAGAVCQLRWMNGYVKARYGTWENALSTWQSRSPHWY
jgi:hypothetical protein